MNRPWNREQRRFPHFSISMFEPWKTSILELSSVLTSIVHSSNKGSASDQYLSPTRKFGAVTFEDKEDMLHKPSVLPLPARIRYRDERYRENAQRRFGIDVRWSFRRGDDRDAMRGMMVGYT
jgi:hypothetical protein